LPAFQFQRGDLRFAGSEKGEASALHVIGRIPDKVKRHFSLVRDPITQKTSQSPLKGTRESPRSNKGEWGGVGERRA